MIPQTSVEQANQRQYAKFQPVRVEGFRLQGKTRLHLEYDNSGDFREYDPSTGDVVGSGRIETPEKDHPMRSAA